MRIPTLSGCVGGFAFSERLSRTTKSWQNHPPRRSKVSDPNPPGNGIETNPCYNSVEILPPHRQYPGDSRASQLLRCLGTALHGYTHSWLGRAEQLRNRDLRICARARRAQLPGAVRRGRFRPGERIEQISSAAAQTSTLTVNTTAASSAENQKRSLF
jgi:hypothetical protein